MRAQKPKGSVVFNKARMTWNLLWVENGQRKSRKLGTLAELPSKSEAEKKAQVVRRDTRLLAERSIPTVHKLVEQYRIERMPQRFSTRRGYEVWLRRYILPHFGCELITALQARPVELWLLSLKLSPKSKAELRGLVRILWEFAMWRGDVATQRNPMELIRIKGSSKRQRQPRSLSADEFQRFLEHLEEPFRTIALVCVCFGLRISECLALNWSDVDWLKQQLRVERGIVKGQVDDTKTIYSKRAMAIDDAMLGIRQGWKRTTQFSGLEDWIFASLARLGQLPWSYDRVRKAFRKAAEMAGIGRIGTHSMRHTYRSWLDAVGTPIAVQQKLMRHSDIRTTMNRYGDVVTNEMSEAHAKVVQMALAKAN